MAKIRKKPIQSNIFLKYFQFVASYPNFPYITSKMNTKTIEKRLLNAFKGGDPLNKMQLRQKLRIPRTELNDGWFDNSFMRTVRKMASKGQLIRVGKGVYRQCRN